MRSKQNDNDRGKQGVGLVQAHPVLLTDDDLFLFNEGTHFRLYRKMGSHVIDEGGERGVAFAVWAPNAESVSVIGDFNGWNRASHVLRPRGNSGIWEGFIPNLTAGAIYKYHVVSRAEGFKVDKADPYAMHHEVSPKTASIVWRPDYVWRDAEWMSKRGERQSLDRPFSIYEVHLGSWRRVPEEGNRPLSYREIAPLLTDHVQRMGFTHVELLPIAEHPFYGSWGYQCTGFFAPTSRYGTPEDFMFLVDTLHQNGIGVILDWVPSHFPTDEHGLAYFDGTHLFEHADPSQGFHPDWKSYIFNFGRNEVPSFLISSAFNWLDTYHIDCLRVDAVASILYLDYSRKQGEWIPNRFGGRENLEAIDFLRKFNAAVYESFPDTQTIAEESTAWPMVSRPNYLGGLGFGMKWDMGWMHDTLEYMSREPIHRKFHHNNITFRMIYAFTENFVLPLSHDEVAHGKGSLLEKMPGDAWQKFANLRLMIGNQFTQSGKKLLFMGGELGQYNGWDHDRSLDWHLLDEQPHLGMTHWIRDLNSLYRSEPALHELDFEPGGFEWIDANDSEQSVLSFVRRDRLGRSELIVLLHFTPVPRPNYRVGVSRSGEYRELLNSDATVYGGSGQGNLGVVKAVPVPAHGRPWSLTLTLPPLGMLVLKAKED